MIITVALWRLALVVTLFHDFDWADFWRVNMAPLPGITQTQWGAAALWFGVSLTYTHQERRP